MTRCPRATCLAALPLLALTLGLAPATAHAQRRPARTAAQPAAAFDPALFQGLEYRMVGPARGGRVTAVAGHADQPSTFYMGATGGGVWKTTDYGQIWTNISDGFFHTGSIGAIRVADSDPTIVWVGTGSDGIRSNVITGRGVYKSTDAGKTWSRMGLERTGQIGAVLIHPTNPDLVYVAALGNAFAPNPDRGVYRTRDGGKSWRKVLFVTDSTGAVDLEFAPSDPNTLYASLWRAERKPWTIISGAYQEGGIYKSADGGDTWKRVTRGLPQGLIGKSDLAVTPADPNRVYAVVEAPEPDDGLYRSDDKGETWRQVSSYNPLMNRPFYYTNVDADPTNADIVYVNNEGFYKSTDGGTTWARRPTPHGDNHDMWISPRNPQIIVQSNDGGANVTLNGGETWSTQHNQPTAELYQVDVDDRFPYWLYAGQQDNTTIRVPSLPPYPAPGGPEGYWEEIGGCETGPAVPKPGDADVVYANCKGRFGLYNHRTGQEQQYYVGAVNLYGHNPKDLPYRFQRTVPIEVSPHDPDVVYHGSQFVHKTTDGGRTWQTISPDLTAFRPERQVVSGTPITRDITGEEHYSVLYVIEESPLERGVIWAGANDGPIHVTRDGGTTWTNVTPPDLPPEGRVQTIDPSPHRPGKAHVAVLRYQLGDWQPYIFRTTDYGQRWTRLSTGTNGIPADHPTRVVREDPSREGLLYAGTEFGMFVSFDDGARWQPLQLNLPVTPVTDLKVVRKDLAISTMGRSFWILDDVTPLHQLTPQVAAKRSHLFKPRDAHRMRYRGGSWRGRSPSDPEFIPAGGVIYYHLAQEPPGDVTLDILDARGGLIRSFSSADPGETATVAQGMRAPMLVRGGTPRLAKSAGMHRFVWDLRLPGAWHPDAGRAGTDGPLAAPGAYQARLTVAGRGETQHFNVLIDPRVAGQGITQRDLEAQVALNVRIRDAESEARLAAHRIEGLRQQLRQRAGAGGDLAERARAVDEKLRAIEARLVTASEGGIRYPQPMLIAQIGYLYNMTTTADQRPGADAYTRLDQLQAALAEIQGALEQVVESDVSALNVLLRERGAEPVTR